jgi:hypothetical protein
MTIRETGDPLERVYVLALAAPAYNTAIRGPGEEPPIGKMKMSRMCPDVSQPTNVIFITRSNSTTIWR